MSFLPARRSSLFRTLLPAMLAACAGLPASAAAVVPAAPSNNPLGLDLRPGFVDTAQPTGPARLAEILDQVGPRQIVVAQLDGPMTPTRRLRMQAAGLVIGQYLPTNAFMVWTNAARNNAGAIAGLEFIRWAGEYQNSWKLAPELVPGFEYQTAERQAVRLAGKELVLAYTFPTADLNAVEASINALPGARLMESNPVGDVAGEQLWELRFELDVAALPRLAEIRGLRWAEPQAELALRSNDATRWILQSNINTLMPFDAAGINGAGQIVGLMDGGMNINHCSFRDSTGAPVGPTHRKVVLLGATNYDQHGTHCSGTAVGDAGVNSGNTRGIAWGAKLAYGGNYNSAVSDWNFFSIATAQHNAGGRVHSNSWGTTSDRSYNALVVGVDRFAYENEESLVLFAVMNCSPASTSPVLAPENGKNVLGIGATGSTGSQNSIATGCTGPSLQGSRRPELWTPGGGTVSSSGSGTVCTTAALTGTSMATPAATGAAALARQYFVNGFYPTGVATPSNSLIPSGALLRSVLVNTAQDMTGIAGYAGVRENWGRLELDQSLPLSPTAARRLIIRDVRNAQGLSTGQTVDIPVNVTSSAEALRVTVSFHEPAGTAGTTNPFINNLNLQLLAPDGTLYVGNNFNNTVNTVSGPAAADNNDNLENVFVTAPATGIWTVRIIAAAVNQGTQGYGLVVTGAVAEPITVQPCFANCDGSTAVPVLGAADFSCFLAKYRDGDASANCDGSTDLPVLGAADFSCFLSKYRAGCP